MSPLTRISDDPLTFSSTTTGLPPTTYTWRKGSQVLTSGDGNYMITNFLDDRITSTYSTLLTISQSPDDATGIYSCRATSEINTSPQSSDGPSTTTGKNVAYSRKSQEAEWAYSI